MGCTYNTPPNRKDWLRFQPLRATGRKGEQKRLEGGGGGGIIYAAPQTHAVGSRWVTISQAACREASNKVTQTHHR